MKSILIGVVLLVVIGAVGLFMLGDREIPAGVNSQENQSVSVSPRTMRDLLTWDRSAVCTYTTETDQGSSSGTTYVANGKVRVDGVVTDKSTGQTMTTSSIIDGGFIYGWTSATKQGFKMEIPEAQATADATTTAFGQDMDFDHEYTYDCDSWTPDESKFVLPTDITFMTMADMAGAMQGASGGVGGGASGSANMCAACEQVTDANAKAQCKAAMGCQ